MFCVFFLVFALAISTDAVPQSTTSSGGCNDATVNAGGCSCSCSSAPPSLPRPRSAIKQCAFNKPSDAKDVGEILTCNFSKTSANTALRATFQGDLRMIGCVTKKCCRRWFLTFNGQECSTPAPIDAVVYADGVNSNLHRPGTLDGFCENIPKGQVVVGISVGSCNSLAYPHGDAHTGWNSVARLIVEEVDPLQ